MKTAILSLILCLLLAATIIAIGKWGLGSSQITSVEMQKFASEEAAEVVLASVRTQLKRTLQLLPEVKLLIDPATADTLFSAYRSKHFSQILKPTIDMSHLGYHSELQDPTTYFIDWAAQSEIQDSSEDFENRRGYQSPEGQFHYQGHNFNYAFSVRCVRSQTFGNAEDPFGNEDNCPLDFLTGSHTSHRANWNFQSWVGLPKEWEIVVRVNEAKPASQVNGPISTVLHEIDKIESKTLNDYAFYLGSIPISSSDEGYTILGGTFFGMIHINTGELKNPNGDEYRIKLDADNPSRPFVFLAKEHPLTTAGLHIDYVDYSRDLATSGKSSIVPLVPNGTDPEESFEGLHPADPAIYETRLPDPASIIYNSLEVVGGDPSANKILSRNCRLTPEGNQILVTGCQKDDGSPTQVNPILLKKDTYTTLYFAQSVKINRGTIGHPVAIYCQGDITFTDSVSYESLSPSHPTGVYLPSANLVPPEKSPLDLSLQFSSNDLFPSVRSNTDALALWVSNGSIKIDPMSAHPLEKNMEHTSFFEPQNKTYLGQGEVHSNPSILVIDGKLQAAVGVQLVRDVNTYRNLGSIYLRGGVTAGTAPVLVEKYTDSTIGCTNDAPCFHGFEHVNAWFDGRKGFENFKGQVPLPDVIEFHKIISDRNWDKPLFGVRPGPTEPAPPLLGGSTLIQTQTGR